MGATFPSLATWTSKENIEPGIYILAISPPPGGNFLLKLKTGKNLKEDLKKGREKGGKEEKKKRVIKHTLKYLYEA